MNIFISIIVLLGMPITDQREDCPCTTAIGCPRCRRAICMLDTDRSVSRRAYLYNHQCNTTPLPRERTISSFKFGTWLSVVGRGCSVHSVDRRTVPIGHDEVIGWYTVLGRRA